MHPKVAGAIQEIDAALFSGDTFDDPDNRAELRAYVETWAQELGLMPLKGCTELNEARVRGCGAWRDAAGVVHVVNAVWLEPDVDLGRETLCGSTTWDPDNPRAYPAATNETVDCMTCIVKRAQLCP